MSDERATDVIREQRHEIASLVRDRRELTAAVERLTEERVKRNAEIAALRASLDTAIEARDRYQQQYWAEQKWAKIVHDLDRSEHGRHEGDAESQTYGGVSLGNPHLTVGETFGYTMDGARIVLPPREQRHDLSAWIQPRAAALAEGEPK